MPNPHHQLTNFSASIGGKYGIVADYTGHGVGPNLHMYPYVFHVREASRGAFPALTLAAVSCVYSKERMKKNICFTIGGLRGVPGVTQE